MASEREIVEAQLREFYPRDDYMAANGLGSEEYEEDTATGADVILAALRESRKADVAELKRFIALQSPHDNGREFITSALAALSRLAGDE